MSVRALELKMSDGSPDWRVVITATDLEGDPMDIHIAVENEAAAKALAEEIDDQAVWIEVQA